MKILKDNFGLVKDFTMVLGMCGVLYLNLNYVTNSKFDTFVVSNDTRLDAIQTTIVSLDKSLALLQQNNSILQTLQAEMAMVKTDLNIAMQQNKEDAVINLEFHKMTTELHKLEIEVSNLQTFNLTEHFKSQVSILSEIETRLRLLEKTQLDLQKSK